MSENFSFSAQLHN